MPVDGPCCLCNLACATEYFFEIVNVVPTNVTVPLQKPLIASQTINVSQTRITSEARGRKCVAFRRRFRKKSGITYHFSFITRHNVALRGGRRELYTKILPKTYLLMPPTPNRKINTKSTYMLTPILQYTQKIILTQK